MTTSLLVELNMFKLRVAAMYWLK